MRRFKRKVWSEGENEECERLACEARENSKTDCFAVYLWVEDQPWVVDSSEVMSTK